MREREMREREMRERNERERNERERNERELPECLPFSPYLDFQKLDCGNRLKH